jgi:hypothetical protein
MTSDPNQVPFVLQLGFALTLFNSWVLFEETVIDRLGWSQYLPCYLVGRFCEWDVAAILVILVLWFFVFHWTRQSALAGLRRACAAVGCRVCRA